jgi:small conductance mechanosensitive channel
MQINLLQAEAAVEQFTADSIKAKTAETLSALKDTEPNVLLQTLGQQALHFGLKVLAALAIYIIGAWLIKRITRMVAKGLEKKASDAALASFVKSLVSITLWVLLIILTVGALGVNTTSLAALLAAGGMAIGMALSGTVQNFAGGIMLLVFKPLKAGDFIEAQGFTGIVSEINITSTKLVTLDNRVVFIPNGALSSGNINNFSVKDLRRVDINVGVAYGTDIEKAKATVLDIIKSNPKTLNAGTPGAADPFVALLELGESTITLVTRTWVKAEDYWDVYFWINENLYTRLPETGIKFSYPQVTVNINKD